jgi:hypothetical protein
MTITDLIAAVRISNVAIALGITLDRTHRRAVASWRRGQNFSVSLNDEKNCWHDFVTNESGGLLSFVERVRGCNRRDAILWLGEFAGMPLDDRTNADKQNWARRMRAARSEAGAMVQWRKETLEGLRQQRNQLMYRYHRALRYVSRQAPEESERRGDLLYELALHVADTQWDRVEALDAQIDRLEAMSDDDLLVRFRGGKAS